jgi:DNA-binding CsgD family transcriptional regulator
MPARKTRTKKAKKPRNRPSGEDTAKRDRAVKALDLRIAGATYRQIGAQLDVSEYTAYHDVQDELGRLDAASEEKAERLRKLEARRLDTLQLALAPGIRAGDPRSVLAAVRIMERRARLFGLDVPTKIAGPEGEAVPIRIVHRELP